MPFPFVLPTTSSFSFSSSFTCESHPSLPLTVTTYRGVVRDELKKHKRLPPASQSAHVSSVVSSINNYLPYLQAIDAGLADRGAIGRQIRVTPKSAPSLEWRPTLSEAAVPGREVGRIKVESLEQELAFVLATLGQAYALSARTILQPLYVTSTAIPSAAERLTAVQAATKHLLDAASILSYVATRTETAFSNSLPIPCVDVSAPVLRGLSSLALAEATLLAVFKDDPYPAIIAQSRNTTDKEYLYKTPDIPKVRAHLFARLCLAAAEHATRAATLCNTRASGSRVNGALLRYLEDTRKTAKARACRFLGIDAELGGETGKALGWLRAGLQELGVDVAVRDAASGGSKRAALSRFKKDWAEKREDRKVEKETAWGSDGGKLEETRIIEYLETKWEKYNNLIETQTIPSIGTLLAQIPSGREIHTIKPFELPELNRTVLESTRAPPGEHDEHYPSSDEDVGIPGDLPQPIGAYPLSRQDQTGTPGGYY